MKRRVFQSLAVASAAIVMAASSATAIGNQTWSLSVASGYGAGQMSSHLPDDYWHFSGYVQDRYSGDDCTYVKILVPTKWRTDAGIWLVSDREVYRKQVCGGARGTFDVDGYVYAKDYVRIAICQNKTLSGDTCATKTMYLT
jgi:hypothetical protein